MKTYKFKNLKIGKTQNFKVKISDGIIKKFINLSGDLNKIHTDQKFALRYGYNKKVVHGMLMGAFYSRFIGMYLPGKYSLLISMDIKFNKPVYLNDKITIKGKVVEKNSLFKIVTVKIISTNQSNSIVSNAKAVVQLNE